MPAPHTRLSEPAALPQLSASTSEVRDLYPRVQWRGSLGAREPLVKKTGVILLLLMETNMNVQVKGEITSCQSKILILNTAIFVTY